MSKTPVQQQAPRPNKSQPTHIPHAAPSSIQAVIALMLRQRTERPSVMASDSVDSPDAFLSTAAVPTTHIVLQAEAVSVGYEDDDLAVEGLSFAIHRGERIALVGPNGAGKSTLLKSVMGLVAPRKGRFLIHSDSSRDAVQRIGYVPQFGDVDWNFPVTVWDVVMMGRVRHIGWLRFPMRGDRHHAIVRKALERVDMANFAHRQIGELSGGEKRRVFIARALAQEADILLLDEPFAGVDVRAQEIIFNVLEGLQSEGITILIATHDLMSASTQFDRVMLMHRELVAFGTPTEVFQPQLLAQAYGGQLAFLSQPDHEGHTVVVTDQHE
jgi:ABC-type Mn2+/Zn2+ transport system ATPase subunit